MRGAGLGVHDFGVYLCVVRLHQAVAADLDVEPGILVYGIRIQVSGFDFSRFRVQVYLGFRFRD